jgi:DNA-binding winged helix-turn-helix (wHTH) protein
LLEHAGEVVTREEIQKCLWPEGTYVEFDNAINNAVRKLRDALGDSPEHPRFVETLARRGYRFIYPVLAPRRGYRFIGQPETAPKDVREPDHPVIPDTISAEEACDLTGETIFHYRLLGKLVVRHVLITG